MSRNPGQVPQRPLHSGLELTDISTFQPAPTIQAKLTVGAPGDRYEQEADRVADEVMRMPEPRVQRQEAGDEGEGEEIQAKPVGEVIMPLVQREDAESEPGEELIQAKGGLGRGGVLDGETEARIHALRGGGRPLDEGTRAFMEPRFGRSFASVRVHTDKEAAGLARELNARAFTIGRDLVFGIGQYIPRSDEGQRLLSHELTHVVQQAGPTATPALLLAQAKTTSVRLSGKSLATIPAKILREILCAAGLKKAFVSSGVRTARRQGRIMFGVIDRMEKKKRGSGLRYSYRLYGPAGDAITRVYEENQKASSSHIVKLMEDESARQIARLITQGAARTELMHVSDSHYVFDVDPNSISDWRAFSAAVKGHPKVSRFIGPPRDRAFHIEIKK